jgi:histidinol dehydrogenase
LEYRTHSKEIFKKSSEKGDACNKICFDFDGVVLKIWRFRNKLENAVAAVQLRRSLIQLAKAMLKIHGSKKSVKVEVETAEGVQCWQEKKTYSKVVYIGGTAPLFSTVLMLAVPATIAGCKENCIVFSSE